MRRISTGIVGREILGRFTAFENSLQSIDDNGDIVLNPNGSGIIRSDAHIQVNDENSVRFADSGSSNYVEIKAPASLGSNITLTLPDGTGSSGDVLTIDGSGNLSLEDVAFDVNNQVSDTRIYYPLMSTSSSGEITGVTTTTGKLEFQPSSGNLTVGGDISCDNFNPSGNVDINGGNIDGTVIGDNSAVNGTFDSLTATAITETSSVRYKEEIAPINDALDKIINLQGVTYQRKGQKNVTKEAGLIAEDVYKYIPNVVTLKDNKPEGINYTKLTAYLIESVKRLKTELEILKNHG